MMNPPKGWFGLGDEAIINVANIDRVHSKGGGCVVWMGSGPVELPLVSLAQVCEHISVALSQIDSQHGNV